MNTIYIDCLASIGACYQWQITIVRDGVTVNVFNVIAHRYKLSYVVTHDMYGYLTFSEKFTLSISNDYDEYAYNVTAFGGGGPYTCTNPADLIETIIDSFYSNF